jgi:hypothetical protein
MTQLVKGSTSTTCPIRPWASSRAWPATTPCWASRVVGNIDDLGGKNAAFDTGRCFLQSPQALVLTGQTRKQLQLSPRKQQLFAQALIFVYEIAVGDEDIVYPIGHAGGSIGNPENGGSQETKGVTDAVEIIKAVVCKHDSRREHHKRSDAVLQRHAFDK